MKRWMLCQGPLFWQRLHQHMHSIYRTNSLPEDLGKRLCQASGRQEQHHLVWHVRWLYGLQGSASCGLSGSGPQASRPASWLALHYLASLSAARDRLQSHSYSPAAAILAVFWLQLKTQNTGPQHRAILRPSTVYVPHPWRRNMLNT